MILEPLPIFDIRSLSADQPSEHQNDDEHDYHSGDTRNDWTFVQTAHRNHLPWRWYEEDTRRLGIHCLIGEHNAWMERKEQLDRIHKAKMREIQQQHIELFYKRSAHNTGKRRNYKEVRRRKTSRYRSFKPHAKHNNPKRNTKKETSDPTSDHIKEMIKEVADWSVERTSRELCDMERDDPLYNAVMRHAKASGINVSDCRAKYAAGVNGRRLRQAETISNLRSQYEELRRKLDSGIGTYEEFDSWFKSCPSEVRFLRDEVTQLQEDWMERQELLDDEEDIEPFSEEDRFSSSDSSDASSSNSSDASPSDTSVSTETSDAVETTERLKNAVVSAEPLTEVPEDGYLTQLLNSIKEFDVGGALDNDETNKWMSLLEGIVILGWQITRANSFIDIVLAVCAYMKSRVSGSIVAKLYDIVTSMSAKKDLKPQALSDDLKNIQSNWDLLKTNTIFSKISYLMSAAMSMTACAEQDIEWSPLGVQVIHIPAMKEQAKATDLIDALLKTFSWCLTTGNACIKEQSLSPILFSDKEIQETNELVSDVLAKGEAACAGLLGPINDFEVKLDKALERVCALKAQKNDSTELKLWCQRIYADLVGYKQKILAARKNTQIRFAPIGWHLSGPSGVGKSTLQKVVMSTSLNAMGYAYDSSRICGIDIEDRFQSTWRSDALGAVIDDMGNGKPDFTQVSPTNLIIKFWNNMAAQAVKPELNAKGVTFIEFFCGVVTSNFKDMNVNHYTCKPEAALRRFHHVRVNVKPEYRKLGGISLDTHHPDLKGSSILKDVWDLTIEECHIYETKNGTESYYFRPMKIRTEDGVKVLKNLSLAAFTRAVIYLSEVHAEEQNKVVRSAKDFDEVTFCPDTKMPTPLCDCKKCVASSPEPSGMDPHALSDTTQEKRGPYKKKPPRTKILREAARHIPELEKFCEYKPTEHVKPPVMRGIYNCNLCGKPKVGHKCDFVTIPTELAAKYCLIPVPPSVEAVNVVPLEKPDSTTMKPHGIVADTIHDAIVKGVKDWFSYYLLPYRRWEWYLSMTPVRHLATKQLARRIRDHIDYVGTPLAISWTPEFIWQSVPFQWAINKWQFAVTERSMRKYLFMMYSAGLGVMGLGARRIYKVAFSPPVSTVKFPIMQQVMSFVLGEKIDLSMDHRVAQGFGIMWFGGMMLYNASIFQHLMVNTRVRKMNRELTRRRNALPIMAMEIRDSHAGIGATCVASLMVMIKLFAVWNKSRLAEQKLVAQGEPESWFGMMMKKLGIKANTSNTSVNMLPEHIQQMFKKNNLFWAEYRLPHGRVNRCNIFFPRKGVAMFPQHVFHEKCDMGTPRAPSIEVVVFRHDKAGGIFKFKVDESNSYDDPSRDLVFAAVPNCPDLKSRIEVFPLSLPTGSGHCRMVARTKEGYVEDTFLVNFDPSVGHKYKEFYGGYYKSSASQDGACMGILIANVKRPYIAGFHIAGKEDGSGACQSLTQLDIKVGVEKLKEKGFVHAESGEIPANQCGKPVLKSKDLHPHAKSIHALTKDQFLEPLGSTYLRSQCRSQVQKSVISQHVEQYYPNKWDKPKLIPNWKAYNATLEHIANPADMFAPSLLERAADDWVSPLLEKIPKISPLTDSEMTLGIDGKRFSEAVKMTTSCGFPLGGPKSQHTIEVRDGEKLVSRTPDDLIMAEYNRLLECYKKGVRGYPVASAHLKDEATPTDSEKVRVFYACPYAFGLLIRKYFLPIAAFLCENSILSECAVGVNAFSGWGPLMDHATKYAEDGKMLGWDYSKYDVRMNSQMTTTVWNLLVKLARKAGYVQSDLDIMQAIITDVVHPLIDYNGTMLQVYNMNTSGNNITVIINGIAGSLYVRMGYFNLYPDDSVFRDKVAALTYGDDFTGSVSPDRRDFNFPYYRNFLATAGVKVTLPDKSDKICDFLDADSVDFLKRTTQYIPEIDCRVGKLCEESIFKSLHCNLASKVATNEEVAISCIETAMHEWFFHGRSTYELRQSQMMEVCAKMGWTIPAVTHSYEARVEFWQEKYL